MECGMHGAPGGARKPCGLRGGLVGAQKTFPQWGKREAPLDMIPCRWQGIPQFQVARRSRVG